MRALILCAAAAAALSVPSALFAAGPVVQASAEQAPANQVLFTPLERTLATAEGVQDLAALAVLGLVILAGLVQLRRPALRRGPAAAGLSAVLLCLGLS